MKHNSAGRFLPFITLGAGILGLFLQIWYYAAATDEKNLLTVGHPACILLWIVVALYFALALAIAYKSPRKRSYTDVFPTGVMPTLGCIAAAIGAAVADIYLPLVNGTSSGLGLAAGAAEVFSFVLLALLGGGRRNVQAGTNCLLSVAFMIRLISQYKQWSYLPQIVTYCFALLASVCFMITAFHRATMAHDGTGLRRYVFFSQLGVFFACLCLTGDGIGSYVFHLTMTIWLLTGISWDTAKQ